MATILFLGAALDYTPNILGEDALAGGVRVTAVPPVQIGISADAFHETGDTFAQRAESPIEFDDDAQPGCVSFWRAVERSAA